MAEAFVIRASWVVPVEPGGALEDHAVVVRGGKIEALLPAAEARARFPGLADTEIHARGKSVCD